MAQMSPVELAKLKKIMSDPVIWARAFLVSNDAATKKYGPWEARDYQAEMLRDRSLKKVYRCGRRCLPGWVKIPDPIYEKDFTVKELYERGVANVYCCDNTFTIRMQVNCPVSYNGKKQIFHLITEDGREIDATANHPFLTPIGWKELKDLSEDTLIAVPVQNKFGETVLWRRVKKISPMGMADTYDLYVPDYHNFVANDIITHNTGKSETMVVEALWRACTNKQFRVLCVTPYENQVNLLFMRMRELIHDSPLVKNQVVRMKNSPYMIEFSNGSSIMGFTTGASSGSGAASVRGQKADLILLDELDYMGENDYSTVAMIAGERPDIGMVCSSTPTGKRGTFYRMCKDPSFGYTEHFHPSMHNPNWNKQMEDEFRAQLTASQYEHEVLAEFGTEESGVFDKDMIDAAIRKEFYIYNPLTEMQKRNLSEGFSPTEYIYDESNPAPYNPFRCIGIDWDAYQAGSSLLVLDFDTKRNSFKVIKTVEVPRGEYTLDSAVNWVVRLNKIYRPSWIFCDRGYGDYQLERLHIYGEEHPSSGLKNKVIGYQFKQSLDIIDPVTKETRREPVKQFMVNQLKLTFERDRMILCPFDELMHKQLIDYQVDHISSTGMPVYTSVNEHFVDALGLAHLAFVLKFPELTQAIKPVENTAMIGHSRIDIINRDANIALQGLSSAVNPWGNRPELKQIGKAPGERRGDYQQWVKVPLKGAPTRSGGTWGRRSGDFSGRSMW